MQTEDYKAISTIISNIPPGGIKKCEFVPCVDFMQLSIKHSAKFPGLSDAIAEPDYRINLEWKHRVEAPAVLKECYYANTDTVTRSIPLMYAKGCNVRLSIDNDSLETIHVEATLIGHY